MKSLSVSASRSLSRYQQGVPIRHDGEYLGPVVAWHLQHVAVLLIRAVRTVNLEVAPLVHLHTGPVIASEGGHARVIVDTVGQGQPEHSVLQT